MIGYSFPQSMCVLEIGEEWNWRSEGWNKSTIWALEYKEYGKN